MCGIAGTLASGAAAREDVTALVAALAHRGPGDRGLAALDGAVLGSARLHVQSARAPSGPYAALGGRVVAVVNGEIWNHEALRAELRSLGLEVPDAPDTAVVAPAYAAWGTSSFARLRGMFALAVHDVRDGSTLLARDRFGIKPLHFAPGPPARFASEAGALGPAGGVDRAALRDFLALGFVPAPRTLFAGVRKVRPGTALLLAPGRAEERAFAAPPEVDPAAAPDVERLRRVLADAVDRHLAGDVAVGVLLSGGLDSSVLAALAARRGVPLRTFTATFPGEGLYDEGAAAREVAGLLGAQAVEVPVRPSDVPDLLARQRAAFGEPFADASFLATLAVLTRAREEVGAVLSGTGADEMFAGYRRYRRPAAAATAAAGVVARTAARVLPSSRRTRLGTLGAWAAKAARSAEGDPAERHLETLAVVPAAWRARLLGDGAPAPVLDVFRPLFARAADPADGARAADVAVYLPDDVLAKEDRAAMAVSVENRVPYLDDEVADLVGRVPVRGHRAAGGVRGGKAWLRAAAEGLLPRRTLDRPKRGFGVPISEWLRGPCRDVVASRLGPCDARVRDHLDGRAVDALVEAHRAGDDELGAAVHALVVLEDALRGGTTS